MSLNNIESRIEEVQAENKYGKRARMVSEYDLVLESIICLNAYIQQENLQQDKSPKSYVETRKIGDGK